MAIPKDKKPGKGGRKAPRNPFRDLSLEEAVEAFRRDPKTYTAVRQRFQRAKTEEQRFRVLVDFATTEVDLRRLTPREPGDVVAIGPTVTTVTVTTVFVPDSAY